MIAETKPPTPNEVFGLFIRLAVIVILIVFTAPPKLNEGITYDRNYFTFLIFLIGLLVGNLIEFIHTLVCRRS